MNSRQKDIIVSTLGSSVPPKNLIDVYMSSGKIRANISKTGFEFNARTRNNIFAECLREFLEESKVKMDSLASKIVRSALSDLLEVEAQPEDISGCADMEDIPYGVQKQIKIKEKAPITLVSDKPSCNKSGGSTKTSIQANKPASTNSKRQKRTRSDASSTNKIDDRTIMFGNFTPQNYQDMCDAWILSLDGHDDFQIAGSCGKRNSLPRHIQPNEGKNLSLKMLPVDRRDIIDYADYTFRFKAIYGDWVVGGKVCDIDHEVLPCDSSCIICVNAGFCRDKSEFRRALKYSPFLATWISVHLEKYADYHIDQSLPNYNPDLKLNLRQCSITEGLMVARLSEFVTSVGLTDIERSTAAKKRNLKGRSVKHPVRLWD